MNFQIQLKILITLLLFGTFGHGKSQVLDKINPGEYLNYKIKYGILNAGNAELSTKMTSYQGKPHLYVRGTGSTTGAVKTFFNVEDLYESYIDYNTGLPSFYVRNVKEGGYTQHFETTFHRKTNKLTLVDKKNKDRAPVKMSTKKHMQDMLSAFYYLRSLGPKQMKIGSIHKLDVWIDDSHFNFKLKVSGTKTIKTKFGKINCLELTPYVQNGRVFAEQNGVKMYVSNDLNLVPIQLKADLVVGSLKADLDKFENLKYPLEFK